MRRVTLVLLLSACACTIYGLIPVSVWGVPSNDPQGFQGLPAYRTPWERLFPPAPLVPTSPPPGPVRYPGEYEPREGVILRYNFQGWNDIFSQIAQHAQEHGVVYMLVENATQRQDCISILQSYGVRTDRIEFVFAPTNAVWCRDYGPESIWINGSTLGFVDNIYYSSRPRDDAIPQVLADYWRLGCYADGLHLSGGNLMSDGHGQVFCSDIIYDDNRQYTPAQVDSVMGVYYGAAQMHVYEHIQWDATGHIDLWAKVLNDTTIMVARFQTSDPNYNLVEGHALQMSQTLAYTGRPFRVVRCPMPPVSGIPPIFSWYRSYLNSLIFNDVVLVPIYALDTDSTALNAYRSAMPNHEVVGINCDDIAPAGGAIHCITMGVSAHPWDYIHDAQFDIEPVGGPVVIPPGGGQFRYTVSYVNLEPDTVLVDYWTDTRLPNHNLYGPGTVLQHQTARPNLSISRSFTVTVPGTAPAGTYTFRAFIGSYLPFVVSQGDSFNFVKERARTPGQ
jgi:agmatine/peptidylarginine deiminase